MKKGYVSTMKKQPKLLKLSIKRNEVKGWFDVRIDGKFTSKLDRANIIRMIMQVYEKSLFNCLYSSGQWVDFTFTFSSGYTLTRKVAFWYFEQENVTTYYLTFEKKGN